MRMEDLKDWLREASRETNPVTHQWWLLARLVQKTFKDGAVPEEVLWVMTVSSQKGGGVIGG